MDDLKSGSKKGTWKQAFFALFWPILFVLSIRWALLEPFVIPSGSLIPTLLIHDHIVVKKFAYGLKFPFTDYGILRWASVQRGDVVVFRYPLDPDVYYVKRVMGLPGDKVSFNENQIFINGIKLKTEGQDHFPDELTQELEDQNLFEEGYQYFLEDLGTHKHLIRRLENQTEEFGKEVTVPDHQYFMMGDNRDESSDSRVWGFVQQDLIIGKAWKIWLSCDETLESASFICNPLQIRWQRVFKPVQ